MADPIEKPSANGHRDPRATANRGLLRSTRETNVPRGNFQELIHGRLFHAYGLDIGSADFRKAGVGEHFGLVTGAFQLAPESRVVVRGFESASIHRGPPDLAQKRAQAAAAGLLQAGIPRDAISIETMPRSPLDPRKLLPQEKAPMRGATIELIPPPRGPHEARAVEDHDRLLKRAGLPNWPSLLRPFPNPPQQIIVDNPAKTYIIAGTKISRQDLVTVGQMLEEERDNGTLRAAQIFAGTSTASEISWGRGQGGGNVGLPTREGGVVDIDWLNSLVGHSLVDPQTASLGYSAGKLGWAIAHGLSSAWSSGPRAGSRTAWGHLRAFGNPSEAKAVQLAGQRDLWDWTFTEILHPDLIEAADDALEAERNRKAGKRRNASREGF